MKNKPTTLTLFLVCSLWTGRSLSDFLVQSEVSLHYYSTLWIAGIVGFIVLITVSYKVEESHDSKKEKNFKVGRFVFGCIQMGLAAYFLLGLIDFVIEGFSTAYIGFPAIFLLVIRGIIMIWKSVEYPLESLEV